MKYVSNVGLRRLHKELVITRSRPERPPCGPTFQCFPLLMNTAFSESTAHIVSMQQRRIGTRLTSGPNITGRLSTIKLITLYLTASIPVQRRRWSRLCTDRSCARTAAVVLQVYCVNYCYTTAIYGRSTRDTGDEYIATSRAKRSVGKGDDFDIQARD